MNITATDRMNRGGPDQKPTGGGRPRISQTSPVTPRLLSQREAATYLGISYWTLRDLTFRREVPYVKIGRRILVDRIDLDTYLDRMKVRSGT